MSHLKKCRRFGVRYGLISVTYEVVWKYNPYSKFARLLCRWKSSYIDSYLKNNYADIIEKYKSAECFQYKPADFAIWFFWWQGWNAAPQLIKNNFMTIKLLNEGGKVIFVSKDNYREYVHIPAAVLNKVKTGMVSYTHLSDIIRVSLLAAHGGLWIDATTWVVRKVPKNELTQVIITRKSNPVKKSGHFHQNRYTCWCLGSAVKGYPLFCFVRDIFFLYCEKENQWIDYMFLDKLLQVGIDYIPIVRRDFESIPVSNPGAYRMLSKMEEPFDYKEFRELCQDSWFFKMSIKRSYKAFTPDGYPTFYKFWLDYPSELVKRGLNNNC